MNLLPSAPAGAINVRKLTAETTARFGYGVGKHQYLGAVQIAPYRNAEGVVVAQKLRNANKDFTVTGDLKGAQLFGQHLCRSGGRRIIITEGEIDCMSVSQVLGHKWDVVSIARGASVAAKDISAQLEFLSSFEQVVLAFDNDEPGREAKEACARLFKPGQVHIVNWPDGIKDASDMLQAGLVEDLVKALWNATPYRPDGIVTVAELAEEALKPPVKDLSWWVPTLDSVLYGRRYGECVALGAGTGVGKSDWIAQQIAHDLSCGIPVGVFAFEQQPVETVRRVAGKQAKKLFHIPDNSWTEDELRVAIGKLAAGPQLYLYDHFGACDWDVVSSRIRFLHHYYGVRVFYLDHLTALAAGQDDEKTTLERITSEIGGLVKELDCWLLFVSHLATPEGKPHEEGGRVMIRHFKGSRAIGFWSHFMLGLERDQQAEDPEEAQTTTLRVLKDRYTGRGTGTTIPLRYDRDTGISSEAKLAELSNPLSEPLEDEDAPF